MTYRYKLFDNNILDIKGGSFYNRQYNIIKSKYINNNLFTNIEYNDNECYVFICNDENIGHMFHDHFFYFYSIWRQNKKTIYIQLYNQYYLDYIKGIINDKYLIYIKPNILYNFHKLHIINEYRIKKIQNIPDYINILTEIKNNCFKYYNIHENRTLNILYGRENLSRKRLLNINHDKLKNNNIQIIYDLSNYIFEDTLKLLSKTKNFIYVFGAGLFYLQFLNFDVKVLEIHPNINDSWTQKYGLSNICKLEIYISNNTSSNIISKNNKGQKNNKLDEDINYDLLIESQILKLLSL